MWLYLTLILPSLSFPSPQATTDPLSVSVNICISVQYVFCFAGLLSLSIHILRFIHVLCVSAAVTAE